MRTIFKSEKMVSEYYREWHYSTLTLVELIVNIYNKKNKLLDSKLESLEQIKPRYSYDAFFSIFICVVKYHLKIKPLKQLNVYNKITSSLGYPIFDREYFKNYFLL